MNDFDKTTLMPRLDGQMLARHDPWGEMPADVEPEAVPSRTSRTRVPVWLIPGLVTAAVGWVGVSGPGLWTDEFATWGMTMIPWRQALRILRYVDVVIAPYYALMHGWVKVLGSSDVALRAPSVIAMALTAALIGVLGNRLAGPRAGLLAGLVFALLPGSSRFAQEARPYAMTMLAAVVATYLLVRILERPTFWKFVAYVSTVAVLGLLHAVALLLLLAHGWVLLARRRRLAMVWVPAAALAVVPVAPVLWLGYRQKHQISWIGHGVAPGGGALYMETLFGAVAVGVVVIALALFSLPLRYPSAVYAAWAVVPLLGLLAAAQLTPLFLPRYLAFTLPAWALLAGAALGRVRVRWAVPVLLVIAALAVPAQLRIRGSAGHDDATRDLARVIGEHYSVGDGVVYGSYDAGGTWVGRDALSHYLPADRRPRDVFMKRPQRTDGLLLATECNDLDACLANAPRLWVVRYGDQSDPLDDLGEGKEDLVRVRYREVRTWHLPNFTLALMVAKAATR